LVKQLLSENPVKIETEFKDIEQGDQQKIEAILEKVKIVFDPSKEH